MDAKTIKDAIYWYQHQDSLHPMTCAIDSRHAILVPRSDGNEVFLECPTCGRVQKHVPDVVLKMYGSRDG